MTTIEARPEPMTIEPKSTAVIVVDMQNDFGAEGGMFARAGIDISSIQAVVPATARVLAAARQAGVWVLYLKMGFLPDLSDSGYPDAPNWLKHVPLGAGQTVTAPDGSESRILVRNTWNTEILDDLRPADGDIIVWKSRFSGFYETELDGALRELGVNSLIFTGCTTSVCVESTLRDAMFRDYHCLLVEDCCAEPIGEGLPRSNHDASLLVTQVLFGRTARSGEVIAALAPQEAVLVSPAQDARPVRDL